MTTDTATTPSVLGRVPALAHSAAAHVQAWQPRRQNLWAFSLGVLSAAAFAPLYVWPLMVVGVVYLVWALDGGLSAKRAAKLGWCFGFGQFLAGLYWIAIAFQFQAKMPAIVGGVAVVLLAAFLAGYVAFAVWLAQRLWSQTVWRILALAGAWGLAEFLRGVLFSGFPWNPVASVWMGMVAPAQIVSLVGAYGLSALTIGVFASVALIAAPQGRGGLWAALGIALVVAGHGMARLGSDAPAAPAQPTRLHIIQANIEQTQKWDPAMEREILHTYLGMTREALDSRGPGIVIWPESAIQNDVEREITTRYLIFQALDLDGVLLMGAVRLEVDADDYITGARNSLVAIDGDGQIAATYDKAHLVPFGEYVPWRTVLEAIGIARLAPGGIDFIPGHGARTLANIPGVPPVGPLICYETIFPGAAVEPGKRPQWLLNISNDAWFGVSTGPFQHLAQAQLRAIEEGLPMVRSTPTGVSAVIDGHGRIVDRLSLGQKAILTSMLPAALPPTLFSRFGNVIPLALFAALLLAGWVGNRAAGAKKSG
jgi:apolipoprotein N-acyltransferase